MQALGALVAELALDRVGFCTNTVQYGYLLLLYFCIFLDSDICYLLFAHIFVHIRAMYVPSDLLNVAIIVLIVSLLA